MAGRSPKQAYPATPVTSPSAAVIETPRKRAKLIKDAAIFTPAKIQGECRFPPDETHDELLAVYHQQFELHPFGEIAQYPRHIPYNSDKKLFLEKTHRECLNVFQYTFRVPSDPDNAAPWTILWDYNIGLVRTTPLFKCTGHSKTTPAKALKKNPGLAEICHSITGGSLVAQGYWIPWAAARAIAATFCYEIRYALTPVFGSKFPEMCLKLDDEHFGDMTINPQIIKQCIEEAHRFRDLEPNTPRIAASILFSPTATQANARRTKGTQAKRQKLLQNNYTSPYSSPYASDTGSEDSYSPSYASTPESMFRNDFTPINTPRTVPRSVPYPDRKLPPPSAMIRLQSPFSVPLVSPFSGTASRCSSPPISPKTIPGQFSSHRFTPSEPRDVAGHEGNSVGMNWLSRRIPNEDEEVAYILLGMKLKRTPHQIAAERGITLSTHKDGGNRHSSA